MNKLTLMIAATLLAGAATTAAQAQSVQIPMPANPTPANPIATDASPLPHRNARGDDGLLTGRSAFAPVGAAIDFGAETLGAAVGVVPDAVDGLSGR